MMTGALFGSAGAALVFKLTGQSYTVTFALATLPATLAVLLLVSAFGGSRECVGGAAGKGDCGESCGREKVHTHGVIECCV